MLMSETNGQTLFYDNTQITDVVNLSPAADSRWSVYSLSDRPNFSFDIYWYFLIESINGAA